MVAGLLSGNLTAFHVEAVACVGNHRHPATASTAGATSRKHTAPPCSPLPCPQRSPRLRIRLRVAWQVSLGAPVFSSPVIALVHPATGPPTSASRLWPRTVAVTANVQGRVTAVLVDSGESLWQIHVGRQMFADGTVLHTAGRDSLDTIGIGSSRLGANTDTMQETGPDAKGVMCGDEEGRLTPLAGLQVRACTGKWCACPDGLGVQHVCTATACTAGKADGSGGHEGACGAAVHGSSELHAHMASLGTAVVVYTYGEGWVVALDMATGAKVASAEHEYGPASAPLRPWPCRDHNAQFQLLLACNGGAVLVVDVAPAADREGAGTEGRGGAWRMRVRSVGNCRCQSFSGAAVWGAGRLAVVGGRDNGLLCFRIPEAPAW
jgi:hypothetical protein